MPKIKASIMVVPEILAIEYVVLGGYLLICSIAWSILITSRCDWNQSKGLLKGVPALLRQLKM